EAGAQAESGEIQPADFKGGAFLAPAGMSEESVGQLPDGGEGPTVLAESHGLLEFGGQLFGCDGGLGGSRKDGLDERDGGLERLVADDGGGFALGGMHGGELAQLELEIPACVADIGIAPGFERADFSEAR